MQFYMKWYYKMSCVAVQAVTLIWFNNPSVVCSTHFVIGITSSEASHFLNKPYYTARFTFLEYALLLLIGALLSRNRFLACSTVGV